MTHKISIIVPNYNHNQFIYEALQSAVNQTLQPYEIIIIDDGSSTALDYTRICNMWQNILCPPRIILINQQHIGIGSALNLGLVNMTGNIFTWLPADDLWKPNKLYQQSIFSQSNPDMVLHSYCEKLFHQQDKLVSGIIDDLSDEQFKVAIRTSCPYYANTFWIPKYILDKVGKFREDVPASEDYQWFYVLLSSMV
jgi:teichuronic acid biosynthesis glycosyltransferase TuaG